MKTVWVVVADEAIARILQWPETGNELEPVEELTDPAAHADGMDLRRDSYGRRAGGAMHGAPANTQNRVHSQAAVTASAGQGEQHVQARDFAQRVAGHLADALQGKRFDELHIVAAPRFLGLLRKALSPQVADAVAGEENKDLVHADNAEISRRLFPTGVRRGVQPQS